MKKKILLNMFSSLLLEVVSLICAFILPRLILVNFGSTYNGIVTSVTQFLSFITLLRGGVGGVTRAALYRPLEERDDNKISSILKATEKFMRRVAYIFAIFLLVVAAIYPFLVDEEFDWFYTFTLVLILGISTFVQYYFGISNQMLLQADQRQYVYSYLQTAATILNTIISVILINAGVEFRLVKLGSALVFCLIPLALHSYVHRKYRIIRDAPMDNSALSQRWEAFAHQIAAFAHSNTDVVLLTLFSNLYQVSIYTVYSMVANGIRKFVNICSNGIDAAIGKLLARNESSTLKKGIEMYEWVIHIVSTIFYVCTAMLIVPFVMIYTRGVEDTNYSQPMLGYLLCISQFVTCIRLPYQNVVEAAGQFRQTKNGAILEAVTNIVVSIPMIVLWGSAGAVTGTIIAVAFRTIQYARYASDEILKRPYNVFIKRFCVSGGAIIILMGTYVLLDIDMYLLNVSNYFEWTISAIFVCIVVSVATIIVNSLFYPKITRKIVDELGLLAKKRR